MRRFVPFGLSSAVAPMFAGLGVAFWMAVADAPMGRPAARQRISASDWCRATAMAACFAVPLLIAGATALALDLALLPLGATCALLRRLWEP
jgi:hypothetical protein